MQQEHSIKHTCMVHPTLYVWSTLAWYSLLCMSVHCIYHTCRIHPTLNLKLLHTTTCLTDISYTVYTDVPYNTPARHTPHQDAAYSTPKLYILIYMSRCCTQWMLYTTNRYYILYLVCQDLSIQYTLCISQHSIQYTWVIHSNLYVRMFQTVYLHDSSL